MSPGQAKPNERPSKPVRIGGNIGLFGGLMGAAAAAIFLVSYVSIFRPFDRPLAIALASFGEGFVSMGLVISAFILSAFISWKSTQPKWAGIMPGAFLVLLSGAVLTWAAYAEYMRH